MKIDRVALLRAVDQTGSISGAARILGISFRGAWDQVQALNNLFDGPLIAAERGRRGQGNAMLTPKGRAVAMGLERMQLEMSAAVARLVDLDSDLSPDLFWSLGMKTSVRNALRGTVERVTEGAVNGEALVRVAEGVQVVSILTNRAIRDLGLAEGASVIVLIQAGDVILAEGDGLRTSARNVLPGRVTAREDGAVNSEVSLDIGGGKTLVAILTVESARALDLGPGMAVTALIKAPHVILATEN